MRRPELGLPLQPDPHHQLVEISSDGAQLFIGLASNLGSNEVGSPGVHQIAVVDLATNALAGVIETEFTADGKGLEVDSNGRLYVVSADRFMRVSETGAEELRFFVDIDVRQFLIAEPAG